MQPPLIQPFGVMTLDNSAANSRAGPGDIILYLRKVML